VGQGAPRALNQLFWGETYHAILEATDGRRSLAALMAVGGAYAGSDLNEVGALLVYPTVANIGTNVETFITITNAGPAPVRAHVSYINGNSAASDYCYDCDFTIPLPATTPRRSL